MKTERRHELQTNELADWVSKNFKAIEPYTKSILAVFIALLVAYGAWSFIAAKSREKEAAEWDNFGNSKEDLNALIARHSVGTPLGNMARLSLADVNLSEGIDTLLKDRTEGLRLLKLASEDYGSVASTSKDPMISQLARCGKAKAEESMGELDEARADYKQLMSPDGSTNQRWIFEDYAKQRLAQLQRPSIKEFYTVLAETQPKAPATPGTPGKRPSTELEVPSSPEKLLPDSPLDKSPIFGTTPEEKKTPDDKSPLNPTPEKTDDKTPATSKSTEAAPDKGATPKAPEAKTPDKAPAPKTPAAPAPKTPKK